MCQVDGGRWLALEGAVRLVDRSPTAWPPPSTPTPRATASPASAPDRVAIEIAVDSAILGAPRPRPWAPRQLGRGRLLGTPLAKKLGIKDGMVVHAVAAPDGFAELLAPAARRRSRGSAQLRGPVDLVVAFFTEAADVDHALAEAHGGGRSARRGVGGVAEEGRRASPPTSPSRPSATCCCRRAGST